MQVAHGVRSVYIYASLFMRKLFVSFVSFRYKEISYNAAANRHLSILDWARIDGKHLLREEVTAGFAFGGHLDLLTKYSETYGIDDRIVESASEGGHLEILKWAKVTLENVNNLPY